MKTVEVKDLELVKGEDFFGPGHASTPRLEEIQSLWANRGNWTLSQAPIGHVPCHARHR